MRFKLGGIVAAAASLGAAQMALAADLPAHVMAVAPPAMAAAPTWTGCYIGANVGGGWSHTDVVDEVDGSPIASLGASNVAGGGQIGCDYQFASNWLFGIQGMFDATGLQADTTSTALGPLVLHGSIPWVATLTARLGYAPSPDWLLYAKGGAAWAHTDATLLNGGSPIGTVGFDQTGWTAGAGTEWRFAPNWSVFAEYDYIGLGDTTVTLPGPNIGTVKQNVQLGLVGLNFRFGGH